MLNKCIAAVVIFLLFPSTLYGQNYIKGKLIDSLFERPVEYASVTLYQTENAKLINGQLTDSTGTFAFRDIQPGHYFLKIEVIGYPIKTVDNISLTKTSVIDYGRILLTPKQDTLNEVVVSGQQREQYNKFDKQVYQVDQFQSAKGGNAIDVIKNMPSITVNSEGEIRLRGSTGFLVLINGKPVLTDATTVLSQLPANAIEHIEIITAPSAKYDADGKAGIINITTKKGATDGLSIILNAQYGLPSVDTYHNKENPHRYSADASLNYKKKKWDISLGGSYQENDISGRRVGDVHTTYQNRYTSFPSDGERSFQRRNYAVRASVIYSADKNNTFTAGFYVGQRRQYRRADITYDNTKTDATTGQLIGRANYFNSNLVKKQGDFSLVNLDYTHTFQNKSSLTVSGLYEYALLDGYTKNLNSHLENHTDTLDYVLNTGRSPLSGIRGKIDYTIAIGPGKLESGYQIRYQKQTGTFLYQNAILGTGTFQTVPEFSADIEIDQYIHGLYTQYSGKSGKLEYSGGLRYEYSNRTFSANQQAQPFQLQLSNLFPSANLSYALPKRFKLKGGFSSRVQRSTSNELNPYPEREHSETLEQGDPQIKPEFVYLSELGLNKELSIGSVFVTLYNQQIKNVVNRVNSVYNDTVINRIYTNAGNARLWGLETGTNLKPIKWWSIYLGGNVYDYKIAGTLFNQTVSVYNEAIAFSINTNHTFTVTKTFSVQFSLNYLSRRPTAQGEDSRFITPTASVKKSFLKGKLTAVFQWQNIGLGIIPSNEQRITTSGSNFYTTTNYIQEKDILLLNLSFNINQQNKKIKLPTSEFGEKEF
ncbi:MAG: TonB-dependent receptor [Chitinophagaceae bacterium]|nr:TonB-dependent receptor [Chitinophagaceae bacterium]